MNGKPSVLYIEDEEDDVFFMRNAFKRLGMEECFHAVPDGERAMAYLTGGDPYTDRDRFPMPTIVLLDLSLPVLSGFEVLAWVRRHPQFRGVPVVVFSASVRADDRQRAEELGATAFLPKPTSGGQFLDMVGRLKTTWLCTG